MTTEEVKKVTFVTATTGMAHLQYVNASTIHHWSSYNDVHIEIKKLVELVSTNHAYEEVKSNIQFCQCLIIDEIGLMSKKLSSKCNLKSFKFSLYILKNSGI